MREFRIKVFLNCFLLALFLILVALFYHPTFAQTSTCGGGTGDRATGLVSTPQLMSGSKFGTTTGACIIDPKTAFVPFKIPSYEDLKSLYYTQSKATKIDATPASGTANQGTIRSALNSSDIILIRGDLNLNGNLGGSPKTAVILVEGNLNFGGSNFTFGDNNTGVVFVVSGNVNIDPTVTQIDAIIIAGGIICTASGGSVCPTANVPNSQPLVINGSLISLNELASIKFRRSLADNRRPAEKINHQIKYLVILRDLLSDTYQKWSEIP
ncbi:hypothetical protein HYS96_00145 [Candidatus Daviesbacteria bacterium]|nr:hypothetical protein [Candidatus Daviesbacteria bacterium]